MMLGNSILFVHESIYPSNSSEAAQRATDDDMEIKVLGDDLSRDRE